MRGYCESPPQIAQSLRGPVRRGQERPTCVAFAATPIDWADHSTPRESFTAYRLPARTPLLGAHPGTIIFDPYPDLADARQLLPAHSDL